MELGDFFVLGMDFHTPRLREHVLVHFRIIESHLVPGSAAGPLHVGPAGSMDPSAIVDAVTRLLEQGFDVVELLHDNDAKGIKAARTVKKRWINGVEHHGLTICACGGEMTNADGNSCVNGSLCLGIAESLCIRHGATHAGKEMNAIARDDADVGLSAAIRKRSNRWHFLCGDKGRVYFSKVYRDIASSAAPRTTCRKEFKALWST
jgi:hypothetical protein